jgi:hypothetical protein
MQLAHEMGLAGVATELVQIPSAGNNENAIVKAVITMEKEGTVQVYMGYGDASPRNVAPAMRECLIRLAETRAKARALRDATNVTMTAFEELGPDVEELEEQAPRRSYGPSIQQVERPSVERSQVKPVVAEIKAEPGAITAQQKSAVESLCRGLGLEPEAFAQQSAGCAFAEMSEQQAQTAIKELNERREKKRRAA